MNLGLVVGVCTCILGLALLLLSLLFIVLQSSLLHGLQAFGTLTIKWTWWHWIAGLGGRKGND
jgi:hypothetical protein